MSARTAADADVDADPVPAPPRRTFYSLDASALRQRITTVPARGLRSRLVSANPPGTASPSSSSPNTSPARARPAPTATATSTATRNSTPAAATAAATTGSASASTTSTADTSATNMGGLGSGLFECNVCLETASEPVVTLCGHLFCWPCLHAWFESCQSRRVAQTCPVCKAGSGADKTVPIYARGREALDPRRGGRQTSSSSSSRSAESTTGAGTAPPRPPPQRPDPVAPQSSSGGASFRFGLFPGMFGVSMSFGGNAGAAGPDAPLGGVDSEHGNQNLSSLMMLIGLFALFNVVFPLLAM
ncbi:hypothetical protein GGF32_007155 [Allomyces javanicus]|nr:hypothetical protein GGF32_007155 [Allomyces javanicus]